MLLLSDGTVMAQQAGPSLASRTWSRLAPDISGNFVNGSWSSPGSTMGLARLYYASNVLPNGNVFLLGGEYSGPQSQQNWTNTGEMYNSVTNTWTNIANFPQSQFGDDPSALLPDGRVLVGYLSGPQTYIYDPATNTWTFAANKLRSDNSDEESWVKLPDNSILSYDVCVNDPSGCSRGHAQRYIPATNTWVDAGNAPANLSNAAIGYELGPAFRLPDGRVFQLGGTSNTAFYTPATNTWVAGPVIPGGRGADDAPGAVLPNGNILFAADTPKFIGPTRIYEFNPNTNTYTDVTPAGFNLTTDGVGGNPGACYHTRMLVLPTGQVLLSNESNQLDVYTPDGSPNAAWRPAIDSISRSGNTVTLTGTQLNGLSEGAAYGDDAEMSSNYPLVQLHNIPFLGSPYLRTSNWSSTGVATGSTPETVQFALGTGIDVLMSVVANGISSPTALAIEMSPSVNNILLRVDPSNAAFLQILNNGSFFDDVPFSSFSRILVTCDSSTDTVSIENTRAGVPVSVSLGNGTDTINVSPSAHNLDNIQGNITLSGGSGLHRLNINDSGKGFIIPFTPPGVYTVTPTTVQRSGTALITYAGMTNLGLSTGINLTVPGTIGITGTAAGTATGVTVQPSPAPNIITVGDGNHTLDAVQGPLTITGGAGVNLLTIDDSGKGFIIPFTPPGVYTVTPTTVQRNGTALITYAGMTSVGLSTGLNLSVPGTVNITGTAAGTATGVTVQPSPAPNIITVGDGNHTLDAVQGPLTITGGAGVNLLTIDDSGFGGNDNYAIVDPIVSVARLPNFSLSYSGIAALNLNTGPGSDTFDIDATSVPTTINAGAGGNVFHISPFSQYLAASILGPLTLNGGGADILDFFDANDPNAETFSFDAVPSSLTLGSTGSTIASFSGMSGGIYVVTNGLSTPDDQSGTVIFDPVGGPPAVRGEDGPGAASAGTFLPESLQAWFEAVTENRTATTATSDATHTQDTAFPGRAMPVAADYLALLDDVFSA